MTTHTQEQLIHYMNKRVALSEPAEQVVGSGNDVIEAKTDAEKHGYTGEATFFKVFPFGHYTPRSHEIRLPQGA